MKEAPMRVEDLMKSQVLSVGVEEPVEEVLDLFVRERIHSAPVVGSDKRVVGVITQTDVLFAGMTHRDPAPAGAPRSSGGLRTGDVMTSPAVATTPETTIQEVCRVMSRLRIHRIPVVKNAQLVGIVSSLDICRAVSDAKI